MKFFTLLLLATYSLSAHAFAQTPEASVSSPAVAVQTQEGASVSTAGDVPQAQTQVPEQSPSGEASVAVISQPPVAAQNQPISPIEKEINDQLAYLNPNINLDAMKSLFFTVWEHDLVIDARRGLTTRAPGTDDGLQKEGSRDIALGGIVYRSGQDWTIWLNSTRVEPDAIPNEVLNLKVFRDYVELEWFDTTTNQVFPIRLRAHQRFNLDTRMFLPS